MRSSITELIARAVSNGLGAKRAAQAYNFIENLVGYFGFGHTWQGQIARVTRKERDYVCIDVESRAFDGDVIGDNQVGALGGELLARVFRDVISFRGESDYDAVVFPFRDVRKNVFCGFELDGQQRLAALHFLGMFFDRAVIGDSSGQDRNGTLRETGSNFA